MKKELRERIEKLKKPELAQPLCLRSEEERAILIKAGPSNCLFMTRANEWAPSRNRSVLSVTDTYILEAGYEPETEYLEIEIEINGKGMCVLKDCVPGYDYKMLCWAETHKDFVCYVAGAQTIIPGNVPNWLRRNPGQTMYARFMKEYKDLSPSILGILNRETSPENYDDESKDGCAASYATGLMDGEEGCIVKPDVSGLQVRLQNTTNVRSQGGRNGEASLSPHYVQVLYDEKWVTVIECFDQDKALAFRDDLLLILAWAERLDWCLMRGDVRNT